MRAAARVRVRQNNARSCTRALAAQHGQQALAVERLRGIGLRAGRSEDRRGPVHRDRRLVRHAFGGTTPGQRTIAGTRMPPS